MSSLREDNPTAVTLKQSECVVAWEHNMLDCSALDRLKEMLPREAHINSISIENGIYSVLKIPHEKIDAFALLNAIEDSQVIFPAEEITSSGLRHRRYKFYDWTTAWMPNQVGSHSPKKSFLRRFVEILPSIMSEDAVVSIPVLLEREECQSQRFYAGVGFGNALLSCRRIRVLESLTNVEWRRFLEQRARKSICKISKSSQALLMPDVVISSLGVFDRNWPSLHVSPINFTIFSTPIRSPVPHIVLWRKNETRVITICQKRSAAHDMAERFLERWRWL